MHLSSPNFEHLGRISSKYTCDGQDISPELNIEDAPAETKTFVLIMNDPDAPAGTWDHWIMWNIPSDTKTIAEGKEPNGISGSNSWGRIEYGGPCPPSGEHKYCFKLYALDTYLDLKEGSVKAELLKAMEGHIIAEAELIGKYSKQ